GQLDNLDQVILAREPRKYQAAVDQSLAVMIVEFVAVPMALVYFIGAVTAICQRIGHQAATLFAETHGTPQIGAGIALLHAIDSIVPLGDQRDYRVRRRRLELGTVCTGQSGD